MRNVDKIKAMQHEIGRYMKKINDQEKVIKGLEDLVDTATAANKEAHRAVDAILAQTSVKYGEQVKDDETGDDIGYRLVVPIFSIDDTLGRFEVKARRDVVAGEYIVGVMERREVTGE